MKPRLHTLAAAFIAALAPFTSALAESPDAETPLAGLVPAPPARPASSAAANAFKGPVDPAPLKPFAEIIAGAKRQPGLLPTWRKDEKVWLEIPKELIGKPFLFTANVANSVGERGLYASQMAYSQMAEFRVIGRQVQLLALNTKFRAVADQASKRAIDQAFSPSLLASTTLAAAEHPERKSMLVDASFLLSDIPGYSTNIENAYRMSYTLDRTNSSFERVRAEPHLTTFTTRMHFATSRIPATPAMATAASPSPPQATPDPRSLFVEFVYSFLALPDKPMPTRTADPRIGHFAASFTDLGGDIKANPRTHYITRWRLEKKDPQAAMSEPVKPITFWLDKNIPAKYRPTVESGILEWNKAFEKIGFKNAIVAKQQPDDADWDSMDAGHASIRWFVGADVGFARGPHHHDPRTGEILDADIAMSDVFSRGYRRAFVEEFGKKGDAHARHANHSPYDCDDSFHTAMDMDFASQLLELRNEVAPDGPEAEAFVANGIKGTIMHEVGHVLGLKHNFKGSSAYSAAQLQDRAFTEANGITNSVMDYVPVNLSLKGEQQGPYFRNTLGPYDYWAIAYAYSQFEPAVESQGLAKIASRSTDPLLAYADDADAGFGGGGMDPLASRFDLTDDPLSYFRKRLKLSQELWARVQERTPQPGDDPLRHRRAVMSGFGPLPAMADLAAKYVGGMHAVRDLPGSGRPAFTPVDPKQQRAALEFLAGGIFSASNFKFPPQLLSSLTVDYNEWDRGGPPDIASAVARVQLTALNRLLSAGTAARLLDLPAFVPAAQQKGLISLNEVYETLQRSIWSELAAGSDIDRLRRNLQREHVRRLQYALTHGAPGMPADAASLLRFNATKLEAQLRKAVDRGHGSVETRAHLAESLGILTEALRARMQRG